MSKTKEQLETEIDLEGKLKDERKISDGRYSVKVVEYIVFSMMAVIATAFLYKLIAIAFGEYAKK